eukprot:CAMPEP_0172499986 /NCGR_PEP_ID=MMETSP1066-20121228/133158_1 /TAXON_ID=671091 /ORGANISM="Coscinodiscus wailesii, Strain CCMP2513" /LENGTH=344 /DNA_ID=CAMNT_0013274005 /DNA_START=255 /DNA_END=1289 /DNA_ORIENTATION=-
MTTTTTTTTKTPSKNTFEKNNQRIQIPHERRRRRRRRKRDVIPLLLSSITLLLSSPMRGNAVIGYIPRGARGLTDREGPTKPREKFVPSEEYLQSLEEKGGRIKEMELKVLEGDVRKGEVKKDDDGPSAGGLRPGVAAAGTVASDADDGADASSSKKTKEEQLKLLQKLQLEMKEASAAAGGATDGAAAIAAATAPQHKISSVSSRVAPTKIAKKSGVVALGQGAAFLSVGIVWARWQNAEERARVTKGIEIFESQKAEFFNVTGRAESDEDIASDLRKMKNVTSADDDDEDDDDDDTPLPPKRKPKPSGGGGGGSPSSAGDGGGDGGKASAEDIDRLKDLFKK